MALMKQSQNSGSDNESGGMKKLLAKGMDVRCGPIDDVLPEPRK